jgi:uncharacterized tellurite resistance protein B-like protein
MDEQLRVLVKLAKVDGHVDKKERGLIHSIASANKIQSERVEELLAEHGQSINFSELNEAERIDCLFNMVQLMKIDGHTYNSELAYCQEIAERIGFKNGVIMELYTLIYTDPSIKVPHSMIEETARKYLKY